MCRKRRQSGIQYDATFSTDPLVTRADLIESHERLFFSM